MNIVLYITEVQCPIPPDITHATRNDTSRTYLSHIGYECETGYSFKDYDDSVPGTIVCPDSGSWQVTHPTGMSTVPSSCSCKYCPFWVFVCM